MTKRRGTTIRKCQCGHEWETAPDAVQLNVHCPSCGAVHEELVAELEAAQPKEAT